MRQKRLVERYGVEESVRLISVMFLALQASSAQSVKKEKQHLRLTVPVGWTAEKEVYKKKVWVKIPWLIARACHYI